MHFLYIYNMYIKGRKCQIRQPLKFRNYIKKKHNTIFFVYTQVSRCILRDSQVHLNKIHKQNAEILNRICRRQQGSKTKSQHHLIGLTILHD